jgi:Right handed beta helix region
VRRDQLPCDPVMSSLAPSRPARPRPTTSVRCGRDVLVAPALRGLLLLAVVTGAISALFWWPPAEAVEIGPDTDLCPAINALEPGEELILRPGEYRGPCSIRRGGTPGKPIIVRGAELGQRPRIVYSGATSNVLNVYADHVVLRGLELGPTRPNVDGVRIFARGDVTVEDCRFTELGGIAVVANYTSARDLVVRRNTVQDSRATAMYFGCHDGDCVLSGLVVENNVVRGVGAPAEQVGYGIQVKLNSSGVVRDNVIVDTKGPGIMVYGAQDPSAVNLVERNVVVGSRNSSGIVVGGGPAVVRNNVVLGNAQGGIGLHDYGNRRLLRGIAIAHNTVWDNGAGGVFMLGDSIDDVVVVNNAVHAREGTPPWPGSRPGTRLAGNVDCSRMRCFADPDRRDFSPHSGSPLTRLGAIVRGTWMPTDDLFRAARGSRPIVGAIERPNGPLPLDPGL